MSRCPNCGQRTERTADWACRWCGYPLLRGSYRPINVTYQQLRNSGSGFYGGAGVAELRMKPPEAVGLLEKRTWLVFFSLLCLVAFGAIEYVTYYVNLSSGVILDFTLLLMLVITGAIAREKTSRSLFLALGLVPLARIASLVVPVAEISEIYWYVLVSIPVFTGIVAISRVLDYGLGDIGLNGRKAPLQAVVALSGVALGLVDYLILTPEPLVQGLSVQDLLIPAFILILSTGLVEELLFRGMLQRASYVLGGSGWVYVAAIYGVLQTGSGSVSHGIFSLLVAVFYGWVVKKTGSVVGVSLSHGLLNIGLWLVIPQLGLGLKLPLIF